MNRALLTLSALFTGLLANANEYLRPVMTPDTEQFDERKYFMMGLIALSFICVGTFILIYEKLKAKAEKQKIK